MQHIWEVPQTRGEREDVVNITVDDSASDRRGSVSMERAGITLGVELSAHQLRRLASILEMAAESVEDHRL